LSFGVAQIAFENPQVEMIVDRPFLFAIEDRRTKALLYLGIVADPENIQ
jgi:serine protease inhibitor